MGAMSFVCVIHCHICALFLCYYQILSDKQIEIVTQKSNMKVATLNCSNLRISAYNGEYLFQ